MSWQPEPGAPEDHYATLPWAESQRALGAGVPVPRSARLATCGWHGTALDDNRGAFCVVKTGGPLEGLLGERLRVTAAGRAVHVLAIDALDIDEDLSLSRPAFARLALLATGELAVRVEVMSGG